MLLSKTGRCLLLKNAGECASKTFLFLNKETYKYINNAINSWSTVIIHCEHEKYLWPLKFTAIACILLSTCTAQDRIHHLKFTTWLHCWGIFFKYLSNPHSLTLRTFHFVQYKGVARHKEEWQSAFYSFASINPTDFQNENLMGFRHFIKFRRCC